MSKQSFISTPPTTEVLQWWSLKYVDGIRNLLNVRALSVFLVLIVPEEEVQIVGHLRQ